MTVFAGQPIMADDLNSMLRTVRKGADQALPASTIALQNDNELLLSVEANTTYYLEAWIRYTAASNTPDLRINYTYPAGATFARSDWGAPSASTVVQDTIDTSIATTGDNGRGAGTAERSLYVKGELIVSATAGTFRCQFAQVTSSVDVVTIKAGSRITLQRQ
ncbi:hypothetical protein [Paractinoplanes atraurantiacus]|uniref:Uncharacterized protein n=1 Tax=Paractinoplanes atraurantiacus TaxID=1036182 RepID=A0A285H2V5_9ACTN|nr:hypothetical protein [Actinoplanes atraurantiacus]SNY29086.1 hypothetical protein SAMN05421748_103189 [Actinoplanes atraurantiacus]